MMLAVTGANEQLDVAITERKTMMDRKSDVDRMRDEVSMKTSQCALACDGDDSSEYEEDMDPLPEEESKDKSTKSSDRDIKVMQEVPEPPKGLRRAVSVSERRKVRRSYSMDASGPKRHSWDAGKLKKDKPDFRWDKLKGEVAIFSRPSSPRAELTVPSPPSPKSSPVAPLSPKPRSQIRKKAPRRTKSLDMRRCIDDQESRPSLNDQASRPTLHRCDSKVRFCLDSNECFEVPRPTKDMKHDLFYTKKEIKVFKAEKKEEKRELKQQRKLEKKKAAATAPPDSPTFGAMESTPIAYLLARMDAHEERVSQAYIYTFTKLDS